MNFFYSLYKAPFPRPDYTRKNVLSVFLFGIITALFVIVFEPFDIKDKTGLWYFNAIVFLIGFIFSFSIYLMEFWIPSIFNSQFKNWKVWKAALWYTWLILFVSAIMFLSKSFLDGFRDFNFWEYVRVVGRMSALTLMTFFIISSLYTYFTRKALSKAASTTSLKISSSQASPIDINLDELLFVESADNYVEIHLFQRDKREKLIYRSSMKNMEEQLVNLITPIVRCHRKYLVNLEYCQIHSSKSRNVSLRLSDFEEVIPVSAKYEKNILREMRIRH